LLINADAMVRLLQQALDAVAVPVASKCKGLLLKV
jgi:hypothetical protein